MSDAGDHRGSRRVNLPGQRFVVEAPEVFQRAATTHQQEDIADPGFIRALKRGDKLRRGFLALNRRGEQDQAQIRRAPGQDVHDIGEGRRLRAGHHTHGSGHVRQRELVRFVEESLFSQAAF